MFSIGETVLYGHEGVCIIERMEEMKVGRSKGQYYVLRPVYHNSSVVFVPANNPLLLQKIRPILTKEEIDELLRQTAQQEVEWIDDAAQRKSTFQAIVASGERGQLLQMLRLLHLHREALQQRGKYLRASDEQLLREAEKLLHSEFAYVLQIPQSQVNHYICEYLK